MTMMPSILAGGQSLMATLNMRLSAPEVLIDINHIEGLSGIEVADGKVRIGALARHSEVAASPIIAEHAPLIAKAIPHIAHQAIRNRGTFGGQHSLRRPGGRVAGGVAGDRRRFCPPEAVTAPGRSPPTTISSACSKPRGTPVKRFLSPPKFRRYQPTKKPHSAN